MLPIPNPIAFTLFNIDIRWYAITMVTGIVLGLLLAYWRRKEFGYSEDFLLDYFIWVVPISVIGARLYYVVFSWDNYKDNLLEIFAIRNGGLAIHGAILFGFIVTLLYIHYKKENLLKFLDFVVPSLALGQAIGRWGNYFNMEAHGRITDVPWAIPVYDYAHEIIYVHPTFLYESILDFALCFFLLFYEKKIEKKTGQATCIYLMVYSIGRFFIEGLRTDSLMFLGLRQAQLISILLFIIGFAGYLYLSKKGRPFNLNKK